MTSAQLSQNPFGQNNRDGRGRLTKEESTKRAFTFSLIAHLGLVAFLVIGISWNNSTPAGVEVELWDSTQQVETPPTPELKTEMKEEAADIAVKKKLVEKEPPIEVYLAVTALYTVSAFAVNRVMALIERRMQIPGLVVAGNVGGGH